MADKLQEMSQEITRRPSFLSSMTSGIGGFFKGMLSGGVIGAVGGALLALAALGITAVTGVDVLDAAVPLLGDVGIGAVIGATAATGAAIGGSALATVGAAAGTVTGVVKSREEGLPRAEDIVNVAKISFAQGVAVGHNIEHSAHQQQAGKHAEKVTAERAAMAVAERQVIQ
jgi:hypothetical protein